MAFINTENTHNKGLGIKSIAKKFLTATVLSSSIIAAGCAYAASDKVVATYSGGKVTEAEVIAQLKQIMGDKASSMFSQLGAEQKKQLIREYINNKLLGAEVEKQKIKESKEYKDSLDMMQEQMSKKILLDRYLEKHVTDKMISDQYDALVKELKGQKEINTSHILVEDEAKAKEIKKKLDKGEKFADLAQKFSKDEGSKVRGGDIGYTMRGSLVPEYEATAYAMKKGEVSAPVKSQFGWHIIKLVDIRDVKIPPKKEASAGIRQKLQMEAVQKYVDELSKDAKIELKI